MEKRIISVLIGLVGACGNNPKTEATDSLIIKALAFVPSGGERQYSEINSLIEELRAEKNKIAPGCAICQNPCGNTSDYDVELIDRFEENKLRILSELHEIAASAKCLSEADTELLYKTLTYIKYDMDERGLSALLAELHDMKKRIDGE